MLYSGFILPLCSFSYLILNSSHNTKSSFKFPFMRQLLYLTCLGSCHWDFSTWLSLTILCGSKAVVVNLFGLACQNVRKYLPRFCWHVSHTHTGIHTNTYMDKRGLSGSPFLSSRCESSLFSQRLWNLWKSCKNNFWRTQRLHNSKVSSCNLSHN